MQGLILLATLALTGLSLGLLLFVVIDMMMARRHQDRADLIMDLVEEWVHATDTGDIAVVDQVQAELRDLGVEIRDERQQP